MTSTALVGSTGLVGSHILSTLLSLPSISSVHSISRRAPTSTDPKLQPIVSTETSSWPASLSAITPPPSIFLSALGTTRAAAGGVENQRKIDYDLNFELAKAAKSAGVKVYVLISTSGANATSFNAYSKMKGELENSVKELGFDTTVILRPGLILGDRNESRPAEWAVRKVAGLFGTLGGHRATDFWAQSAETIARAGVAAGVEALGGGKPRIWEIGMADIVRLGRTDWKA